MHTSLEGWIRGTATIAFSALLTACATRSEIPPAPASAPTPEYRYVIGPGDSVSIQVWRNPELSASVPVRPDGLISFPLVEDLQAAGRDGTQLAREVEVALSKYIQNPIVTILVGGFVGTSTQQIRIIGSATRPQAIPYRQGMDLFDVMIAVGGITEAADGNGAKIVRTREGNKEYSVRIKDLLKRADISANVEMKPGDVLVIPESWF